ncbi:hypothetical protein [Georgenia alba]|uniref:Uncharacterized protein n=1 Tax=Georgenia alba TaxID=2233858 RepID=A0ABW2Q3H8_9MICO
MDIALLTLVVLGIAVLAYTAYLVRVVHDDDRGHAFTGREAPRSHRLESTAWPPRSL